MSLDFFKQRFDIEVNTEHRVLKMIRGISAKHNMKLNYRNPQIVVVGKNGENVTILAGQIWNESTVAKFFAQALPGYVFDLLSYEAPKLALRYSKWLRTAYTDRYKYIKKLEDVEWLNFTCLLAMVDAIAHHKHETHTFLDEWVAGEYERRSWYKNTTGEMAREVNHGTKDPEHAVEIIERFYEKVLHHVEEWKFAPYKMPPQLPAGTPDPLAFPEEEVENDD